MSDLYNRIEQLCQESGINMTEMCRRADVPRGNLTDLKNGRQSGLSIKNLDKIASLFSVPVGFLLGRPPFHCWDLINQNRKSFLRYAKVSPDILRLIWGIDPENPDAAPSKSFISFLSATVEDAGADTEGDWIITLKPEYREKAPTPEGERMISDAELKAAFFGGYADDLPEEEIDALWEDAREYAMFKASQKKRSEKK